MDKDNVTTANPTSKAVDKVWFFSRLMQRAPMNAKIPLGRTNKMIIVFMLLLESSGISVESLYRVEVKRINRTVLNNMMTGIAPMATFAVNFLLILAWDSEFGSVSLN